MSAPKPPRFSVDSEQPHKGFMKNLNIKVSSRVQPFTLHESFFVKEKQNFYNQAKSMS
jgi:hypothetical protein